MGMIKSRWASRSSKSLMGPNKIHCGFDSHSSPLLLLLYSKLYIVIIIVDGIWLMDINNDTKLSGDIQLKETNDVTERLIVLTKSVMNVNRTVLGTDAEILRVYGELFVDSERAYDFLYEEMSRFDFVPLLRSDNGIHLVIIIKKPSNPKLGNPLINITLFAITMLTCLYAGSMHSSESIEIINQLEYYDFSTSILTIFRILWSGWPFAISLLGILFAHEMGHYLAAKKHGATVTLPYFIPMPGGFLGTMGAVIQMKAPVRNKKILHDIGVSGPLAGLAVALPVVILGLYLSEVGELPFNNFQIEGNSILYLISKVLVFGEMLPRPYSYGDINPLWYWIGYFFTGNPSPAGGIDVYIHPVALAGWAGLLVTGLNLIPVGQLDGGHVLYVLFGSNAKKWRPVVMFFLIALGFVWTGWWWWAVLLYVFGTKHPELLDEVTELDDNRKVISYIMLMLFFLVIVPVPFRVY